MMDFIKDLLGFLKERKLIWMAPLIMILMLLAIFIITSQGSVLAPFIYTLF